MHFDYVTLKQYRNQPPASPEIIFFQFAGSVDVNLISTKAFLFRFKRTIGRALEELVLGLEKVSKCIQWRKDRGPIFGLEELGLSSDMREATTSVLLSFAENGTNESSLLRENNTCLHDIEVLVIGGETNTALSNNHLY